MTTSRDIWDRRFMRRAREVAGWSKDPDHQVGAVLVSPDRRESVTGYNGPPEGFDDDYGIARMATNLDTSEGMVKRLVSIHAEVNAVLNCHRRPTGWTLYCTRFPCAGCAVIVAGAGVRRVVVPPLEPTSSWYPSQQIALELLRVQLHLDVDHPRPWPPEEDGA